MTGNPDTAKRTPNFYINQGQFDQLVGPGFWTINELPLPLASRIGAHFGNVDAFAFYCSGVKMPPFGATGNVPLAGIDWVRMENQPKPHEPPLNVYHYLVGTPGSSGYPVYGPFEEGGLAPHWSELDDLDAYLGARRPDKE